MNYFIFIIIIFILNYNNNIIIQAETINGIIQSDYNCATSLISKLKLTAYFTPSIVCVNSLPCDGIIDCGLYITCNPNTQRISSFKLQSKDSTVTISDIDINCFASLDSFTLVAATLDSNFLNKVNNTNSIFIDRGIVPAFSTAFNSNIKNLTINLSSQFNSKFKLSFLQYLNNFKVYSLDSYYSLVNIFLEDDLESIIVSTNGLRLDNLEIIASNLVSFQLLTVTNLTITFGSQFSSDSYNKYFSTFNNIDNLYLKQPILGAVITNRIFPRELSNSNSNLLSFISEVPYNQVSSSGSAGLIDLSSLSKLKSLSLLKVGSSFHSGFNFPFSRFSSSLKSFTFTGGNLTMDNFDFTIFNNFESVILSSNNIKSVLPNFNGKNISNFDLSSNSIISSISNSWCNTNLIISNNQLTDTVPTCFSTFFCLDKVYKNFINNSFTPSISNTCGSTTLPGMIKIVGSNTILYGKDLGLASDYITSTPALLWKPLDISSSYYIENYNIPTNFSISFSSANSKLYKLSSSDSGPIINSYGIGGTNTSVASITIQGAYFSYNTSAVQLYYNNIGCIIATSSFESIACRIKEFEPFYAGGKIQITTLKINDKQIQFMSNITLNSDQNPKLCDASSCGYFDNKGTCQIGGTCLCNSKFKGQYCQYENIYIENIIPSNQFGGVVYIYGWFTSTHYNLQVKIGDSLCTLISFTDTQIICNAQAGIGIKVLTITQNDNQSAIGSYAYNASCPNDCFAKSGNGVCSSLTGICRCSASYQSDDCSLPFKQCPISLETGGEICSGSLNTCNNQTGICTCDSNHQSNERGDCSLPFKQCPINLVTGQVCSGSLNSCNNQTGICTCDSNHQSNERGDCSLPFKQCPIATNSLLVCNGPKYGNCVNTTGLCACNPEWTGNNCTIPNIYCSSITPAPTDGNIQVTLYGWFGYEYQDIKVIIGGNNCPVINSDYSTINCTVAPGQAGITSVNITLGQITFYAKDRFQYYNSVIKEKECPNSCSNNGQCNNGICLCNNNFSGFDCSAYSPEEEEEDDNSENSSEGTTSTPKPTNNPSLPPPPPKSTSLINNSSSVISISNEQTNYNLLIIQLVELDINGKPVTTFKLKDNWKFDSVNSNKTIYKFNQHLNNLNNPNNNTWINSTVEEVQKNRIQEFAGTQFKLERSAIKVSIEIENYIFSNNLNTLQLQIESSIDILEDYKGSNQCNNNATTNISESNLSDLNLNYIKIIKNSKVLFGRFINSILADGRATFITSSIIDKNNDTLVIGLQLPHSSNIIVDPDFSVLVDKSYKSSCDANEKDKPWLLPVSIVVPTVVVSSLIIIGALVYRKHHVAILLAKDKYKFSLKSLSKKNKDELYLS